MVVIHRRKDCAAIACSLMREEKRSNAEAFAGIPIKTLRPNLIKEQLYQHVNIYLRNDVDFLKSGFMLAITERQCGEQKDSNNPDN